MTLSTRKPTGRPAWPLILVEGEEKAGKSFVSLALSASPLVGRTFAWDLGDGTADEYAALGPYEIVETNGTYSGLFESVAEATALPPADDKPNVYVIDSGTDLWNLLKRWTDTRARQSRAGRAALERDPDAEIDPATNLWNDAKDRWAAIVNLLRRAPGIGIITAQGGEVMAFENGVPVANRTTWSVQAEKTIQAACTAHVRVRRDPRSATLVGVRRLGLDLPAGGLALPLDHTLHHLVFEVIGAGASFDAPAVLPTEVGVSKAKAMRRLLDGVQAARPEWNERDCKDEARRIWQEAAYQEAELTIAQVDALLAAIEAVRPQYPEGAEPGTLAVEPGEPEPEPQHPEGDGIPGGPEETPLVVSPEQLAQDRAAADALYDLAGEVADADPEVAAALAAAVAEADARAAAELAAIEAERTTEPEPEAAPVPEPEAPPQPPGAPRGPSDTEVAQMGKVAAIEACRALGLPTSGTLAVLQARLLEYRAS